MEDINAQEKFHLYAIDGDYGLPSLDVDSTQSILYTTIAHVPIQPKLLNNVKNCLLYSAPMFVHKNLSFKSFHDTVLYLRTLNYNLDKDLTPKQSSESMAIMNMVQSKLRPVLDYIYWLDQRNFDNFTRLWFTKALPLPFNHIYVRRFRENAQTLIDTLYPQEPNLEIVKDYLNTVATECLSTLSVRLATSDYIFGTAPTTLDVIIYAYIAPLVKIPFPNNEISNLVTMWPNLINFVKRIDSNYLPEASKESKYIRVDEKTKNDDDVSYVAVSILTVSAVTLVLVFAFSRGIMHQPGFD